MASIESGLYNLGWLDQFSLGSSPVHRIDPRAKLLTTLAFIVCVVSFPPYDIADLVPFAIFPVVLAAESGIPGRELGKRLLVMAPFAVLVGALNPLFDRTAIAHLGALPLTGGFVSWASIIIRFLLTASVALILVAATGMANLCAGMERLGAPRVLTTQLLLLYRYLFVLAEETMRMGRARSLRSFGGHGMGQRVYSNMLGHLAIRTADRGQRVHDAMLCRGFSGSIRSGSALQMRRTDWAFLLGWSTVFVVLRTTNVPLELGNFVTGVLS